MTHPNLKNVPLVLLILFIIGCCLGTFEATRHYTFRDAYYKGHSAGFQTGSTGSSTLDLNLAKSESNLLQQDNDSLTKQYNQLSDNYNTLRSAVIKYVGSTSYQATTHVSCTSSALGSYTYTNCY